MGSSISDWLKIASKSYSQRTADFAILMHFLHTVTETLLIKAGMRIP